ncbi:methyltransferase domain-containing protein [Psychroserpens mesophilus]|uniref:methyltransferase domain-containing protein n=1 Tax=Psychroserpens mesophilus TaxID=325473 RepID=UPI003D651571
MKIKYFLKGYLKGKLRKVFLFLVKHSSLFRRYLLNHERVGGNSLYCYRVWMKHLKYWSRVNDKVPQVVVEFGPGKSLGVGLSALLSGSEKLFALEKNQYWNIENNVKVFDELVELFKAETKTETISSKFDETPNKTLDFPSDILTKLHLSDCLKEERINNIRKELFDPFNQENSYVISLIPWEKTNVIQENTVDYIISHTVLQHIDNLPFAYTAMNRWLKPGGCISHKIDFKSMNRTKLWNEHWTLSKLEWDIVTGQSFVINRAPLSSHLKLIEANNFKIIYDRRNSSKNEFKREDLADNFKHLDDDDLTTSGYYYFAQLQQ